MLEIIFMKRHFIMAEENFSKEFTQKWVNVSIFDNLIFFYLILT